MRPPSYRQRLFVEYYLGESSRSASPARSGRAEPFPAGYCHPPTAGLGTTELGPISTIGSSIYSTVRQTARIP